MQIPEVNRFDTGLYVLNAFNAMGSEKVEINVKVLGECYHFIGYSSSI